MTKREIMKSLEPVDPSKATITISLESTADGKKAELTFESDVKMSALDFLLALTDYANELANELYAGAKDTTKN